MTEIKCPTCSGRGKIILTVQLIICPACKNVIQPGNSNTTKYVLCDECKELSNEWMR